MMPSHARRREPARSRSRLIPVLVGLSLCLLGGLPGVAASAPSCADAVVVDWSEDGHVDGIYQLTCYQAAIRELPPDVRDYSTASDEINRALAVAVNKPKRSSGASVVEQASRAAVSGGPDAFPLPLVGLGGITLLVLSAGAAGYLARRTRGER